MHNTSQIAFIDTETTGLDPERDYVWEVAVIVDDTEHVWQQRIPGLIEYDSTGRGNHRLRWDNGVVSTWVIENTGIKDRYDHDKALEPLESIARLESLVRGRHLVGACPWFDSERLHRVQLAESDHRDLLWHYHLIDVETLAVGFLAAQGLVPDGLPWNSDDLSRMVGVEPPSAEDRHSALADARWARDIYEAVFADV